MVHHKFFVNFLVTVATHRPDAYCDEFNVGIRKETDAFELAGLGFSKYRNSENTTKFRREMIFFLLLK